MSTILHPSSGLSSPRWSTGALLLAAACSGGSSLIAEVVWSRYLHLTFGTSAYAIAVLMACFMFGLAIGNVQISRVEHWRMSTRTLLVTIESTIGAFLLVSPLLYWGIGRLSATVTQASGGDTAYEATFRLAGSAVTLLVPTALMGATVPLFLKLLTPHAALVGRRAGAFSAMNTLGAAAGAFAAGFILMPTIGLRESLYCAAALNFIAAVLVRIVSPARQPVDLLPPPPAKLSKRERLRIPAAHPLEPIPGTGPVILAIFVSGFVGMAYEIAYARLLTLFFRDTVYDLTIVLTAFLCGSALGGAIGSLLVRKAGQNLRAKLAEVQIITGFCGLASLMLVAQFPYWINDLQTNTALVDAYGASFWTVGTMIRFGYAFMLLLIPAGLCGAAFPLVMAIVVKDLPNLSKSAGVLACLNAVGSAAGAIAGGWIIADLLGIRATIIIPSAMSLLVGVALLRNWSMRVGLCVAAVVLAFIPTWDKLRMSTSFLDPNQNLSRLLALQFYREDAYGLTSVVELRPLSRRYLVTNRLYAQNNSEMLGLEDHRRLGHIPMLLHPNPQSVLAVGLGAGITLRGINDLHPAKIDCVEIAPAVIEAARLFASENGNVLDQPNVSVLAKDARGYLAGSMSKYDVVVLDILHPMSSGSSTVFSREYYELCKARLNPGGLVCQWLPVHQLTIDQIGTIIATFRTVFPKAGVWYGMIGESTVVGIIGGVDEMPDITASLPKRYEDAPLVRELTEVNLGTPELLKSHFVSDQRAVSLITWGSKIDTDDRPIIEFTAPKIAVRADRLGIENLLQISQWTTLSDPSPAVAHAIKAKQSIIQALAAGVDANFDRQDAILRQAIAEDPTNVDLSYISQSLAGRR